MAVRKRRPVLYEVVRRNRTGQPEWKYHPEQHRREPFRPVVSPPTGPPSTAPESAAQTEVAPAAPTVQVVGERVHLSLGWPAIAVVLAGFLVALAISFHAGTRYAQQTGASPDDGQALTQAGGVSEGAPDAARVGPARSPGGTRVTTRQQPSGQPGGDTASRVPQRSAPPTEQPAPVELRNGYHYVFVQFFPKSKLKDAQGAAAFLRTNGLDCTIQRARDDIRLIASRPFLLDQRDAAARQREKQRCEELKGRIKQLGKEYARAGGGYTFDQCVERKIGG